MGRPGEVIFQDDVSVGCWLTLTTVGATSTATFDVQALTVKDWAIEAIKAQPYF